MRCSLCTHRQGFSSPWTDSGQRWGGEEVAEAARAHTRAIPARRCRQRQEKCRAWHFDSPQRASGRARSQTSSQQDTRETAKEKMSRKNERMKFFRDARGVELRVSLFPKQYLTRGGHDATGTRIAVSTRKEHPGPVHALHDETWDALVGMPGCLPNMHWFFLLPICYYVWLHVTVHGCILFVSPRIGVITLIRRHGLRGPCHMHAR